MAMFLLLSFLYITTHTYLLPRGVKAFAAIYKPLLSHFAY